MAGLRLGFFGSPQFAVPALAALIQAGHAIEVVYTQPPRPSGRGHRLTRCAVHEHAASLGLLARSPAKLRGNEAEWQVLEAMALDAAVVAAYGLILPRRVLKAPRLGCFNIHASLLPRWRGAAPIQAAVLAGDTETGVTIMQMDEGLDTGPMLLREATPIGPRDDARVLLDRLAAIGARLIVDVLAEMPPPVPQPEAGATYAAKLTRADALLDWSRDSLSLDRQIRGLTPWPGTYTTLPTVANEPTTLKILSAHPVEMTGAPGQVLDQYLSVGCGSGALRLDMVQVPGRPPLDALSFMRGHPMPPGSVLGAIR